MNLREVGLLLKDISSLDPKFGVPNEDKAKAWHKVLTPHLTLDTAIDFIAKHYSQSEKTLMPADLNSYYRSERKNEPLNIQSAPPANLQLRKAIALDLEAKIKLEKEKPYTLGGNPWKYPMGSGKYATEARNQGITLKGDSGALEDGFQRL